MKRFLATAVVCLGLFFVSAPASAQVGLEHLFQGPWNQNAQGARQPRVTYSRRGVRYVRHYRAVRYAGYSRSSYGMPPANARCGWFMGRLTGHTDRSLWLAQNWARRFPRTHAHNGAIAVWNRGGGKGHVAKIVSMQGNCRAVVQDNMGTYSRDICRGVMAYVRA